MKITPSHFRELAQRIKAANASLDLFDLEKKYRAQLLRPQRFRWDLLSRTNKIDRQFTFFIESIYKYADDSHIDTALRAIAKECGLLWASK